MRTNLNQLYVFYLAAMHKSLKAAARALYVSPPAVTMQIKKLESWLGFSLFERKQGDLKLNEYGRELYAVVAPVFSGLGEMDRQITELMQAEEPQLRLGAHHLPANYFIPDLIAHVRAKYPELKVQMDLGTQDDLLEKLFQQKLDLVLIIGAPPANAKCRVLHIFDVEVALVVASGGQCGRIDSIPIQDISRIPLILQQKGTGALRAVLGFLAQHNARPDILLENLSSDVIKTFLQKMPSCAFIGRFIVQKELNEGILHEIKIDEGCPICRFNLVYPDTRNLPLKLERFLTGVSGFSPGFKAIK